jgi:hypothetical protein
VLGKARLVCRAAHVRATTHYGGATPDSVMEARARAVEARHPVLTLERITLQVVQAIFKLPGRARARAPYMRGARRALRLRRARMPAPLRQRARY